MSNRDFASKQLDTIRNRIKQAALQAGRNTSDIRLIGASKLQSSDKIKAFQQQGLNDLGENYLQEALQKQKDLADFKLTWHFIGKVQSNKTASIAHHFDWVHGVDRLKIAQRLSQHLSTPQPADSNKMLNLLIQTNIDNEASKSGVCATQVPALCDAVNQLEHIKLQGLMLIPKAHQGPEQQRKPYAQAYEILQQTNQRYGLTMQQLSMGMSNDLEAAITEGATMIRIGTALFGERFPTDINA